MFLFFHPEKVTVFTIWKEPDLSLKAVGPAVRIALGHLGHLACLVHPAALQNSSQRWTDAFRALMLSVCNSGSKAESYFSPSSLTVYEDTNKIFKSISFLNLSNFCYGPYA